MKRPSDTTPSTSLTARKHWARTVSKALGHSRAHKDLLAYLAFRAGTGKVWNYSLADLAESIDASESTVRRGLRRFVAEGTIAIKRSGPKPSEYTLNLAVDDPARVFIMDTKSVHFRHGKRTTKLQR